MDNDVQHLLHERRYSEAFEQLLDRYDKKVFRMALTFLRDTARAEEVTQEVFLKLWQALPDLRTGNGEKGWDARSFACRIEGRRLRGAHPWGNPQPPPDPAKPATRWCGILMMGPSLLSLKSVYTSGPSR